MSDRLLADLEQQVARITRRAEAAERANEGYEQVLSALLSVSGDRGVPSPFAKPWRARAEQAEAEVTRLREHDDRVISAEDDVNSMAEDLRAQVDWAQQLYAAWWSARIGRAMARLTLERTRDALSEAIVEEQELTHAAITERDEYRRANGQMQELATLRASERDQFKAAIDRVRRLCDLTIAVSMRVDAIDQARDTLAALDQIEASTTVCSRCNGNPVEQEFGLCESCNAEIAAINAWAANLDPRKEG